MSTPTRVTAPFAGPNETPYEFLLTAPDVVTRGRLGHSPRSVPEGPMRLHDGIASYVVKAVRWDEDNPYGRSARMELRALASLCSDAALEKTRIRLNVRSSYPGSNNPDTLGVEQDQARAQALWTSIVEDQAFQGCRRANLQAFAQAQASVPAPASAPRRQTILQRLVGPLSKALHSTGRRPGRKD